MATALSNEPRDYILDADKKAPVAAQVIFSIKPLSARQQAVLSDMATYSGRTLEHDGETIPLSDNANEIMHERLLSGLKGWRNFKDEEGNEVKFDEKNLDANADLLDPVDRMELSNAILLLSIVSKDAAKN